MNIASIKPLALATVLALAAGPACAVDRGQDGMSESDVRSAITAAGYTDIDDLDRDDGLWEADARRDGRRVELRIDPRTGTVYPEDARTSLTEADVRAGLEAAGYELIRDVHFDDGMWEADAEQGGVDYDLFMDPETGEVVARKRD